MKNPFFDPQYSQIKKWKAMRKNQLLQIIEQLTQDQVPSFQKFIYNQDLNFHEDQFLNIEEYYYQDFIQHQPDDFNPYLCRSSFNFPLYRKFRKDGNYYNRNEIQFFEDDKESGQNNQNSYLRLDEFFDNNESIGSQYM